MKRVCDLPRTEAFTHQPQYFEFPVRQPIERRGSPVRCPRVDEALQHLIRHLRAYIDLMVENAAERYQYILCGLLLHDVAIRTRAQGPLRIDGLVVHRENQHRQRWVFGPHTLQQIEAVWPVERNIDYEDVRLE